jgi:hypothetical protein
MKFFATVSTLLLAFSFITGSALAAETEFTGMKMCLGEAQKLEAPDGYVYTYTQPKYGNGYPSMALENGALSKWSSQTSDAVGTAMWAEIQPNANAIAISNDGYSHDPIAYMNRVTWMGDSRAVIHARSEGTQVFTFWAFNPATGDQYKEVIKAVVSHCSASSLEPAHSDTFLCEGSVIPTSKNGVVVKGHDSVLAFKGAKSGRKYMAGLSSGRALLRTYSKHAAPENVGMAVVSQGKGDCSGAGVTDLEPVDGKNNYQTEICVGETLILPAANRIATVDSAQNTVGVERSVRGDGMLIKGIRLGAAKVVTKFQDADANNMLIFVDVVECN